MFFSLKELDSISINSWLNIKETTAHKKVNHKSWYCVYSFPILHILKQTKVFLGRDNVSSAMKLFGWKKWQKCLAQRPYFYPEELRGLALITCWALVVLLAQFKEVKEVYCPCRAYKHSALFLSGRKRELQTYQTFKYVLQTVALSLKGGNIFEDFIGMWDAVLEKNKKAIWAEG